MGFREAMNENPRVGIGASACLVLLVFAMIALHAVRPKYPASGSTERAFYSDDEGASWFVDDAVKPVPFDHNGKEAFRAEIFRCKNGKPFVAYLTRYSDAVNAQLAEQGPMPPNNSGFAIAPPTLVRK